MKRAWTEPELAERFTIAHEEAALLPDRTEHGRLGFAVLLKFLQDQGRFPSDRGEVPAELVGYLARQLGVAAEKFAEYEWQGRTIERHRAAIREVTGFREVVAKDTEELARWLADYLAINGDRHLQEVAYQRLRELRIEPPSPERVQRLVGSAVQTCDQRLNETVLGRLSPGMCKKLDALLQSAAAESAQDGAEDPSDTSTFSKLRKDPGPIGLESALEEVGKLGEIRQIGLPPRLFEGMSARVPLNLRRRAAAERLPELRRHPEPIRYMLLSAFCWVRSREITDNLVELLLQIVHRIGARAEKKVVKEILEDLKRVHGKSGILFRLAEASLEEPDGLVRDVVYPAVGEQTLRDLVREFRSTGLAYKRHVQTRMRSSYGFHFRRMVPALLGALEFRSNNELHRPVIEAIDLLKRHADSRAQF